MNATSRRLSTSLRYAQAISGSVATAGAHFVLSLVLLHALAPDAFGSMAFLLLLSQLGSGLWNALFCAPLPVLLARDGAGRDDEAGAGSLRRCMLATNLAGAAISLLLFAGVALALGLAWSDALLFAAYAACFLLRAFARADAYAAGHPLRATGSDLAYSVVLLGSLVTASAMATPPLTAVCAILLGSAVCSLLPFGGTYRPAQFTIGAMRDIRAYAGIWRTHSRWSFAGVLTTEATTNSHAYLLTLVLGPGAFAPIAASALLIRPIGVVVNALTEFERPNIARQIGQGDFDAAMDSVRFFHLMLTLAWVGSAIAAILVLVLVPHMVFPAQYDLRLLACGTALWMAVALVRQWRAPGSVLLQAAGEFRSLATASMVSSLVSLLAVAMLLRFADALWSIAGILAGEAVCAALVWRQARRYRRRVRTCPPSGAVGVQAFDTTGKHSLLHESGGRQ